MDERIDAGVLRWFGHVERMENDRIAKRVDVGECSGSHSVGRPQKRWIDTVKNCLKKPRFGCREDGRGERGRLPRTGMAVGSGTVDEPDGNSISRAEKWLERAKEKIGGEGDCVEEERTDGREEDCIGAAPL